MPKSHQNDDLSNLLSSLTSEILISMTEMKLRKQIIIPLLKEIGAMNVIDMHGRNEEGIDVYFESYDIFDHKRRYGIQIKRGNINRNTKPSRETILTIINQIRLGFSREINFIDSEIGKTIFTIDGYYIIISGKASDDAKEYILKERKSFPFIHIIEGEGLMKIIQNREILEQRFSIIATKLKVKS